MSFQALITTGEGSQLPADAAALLETLGVRVVVINPGGRLASQLWTDAVAFLETLGVNESEIPDFHEVAESLANELQEDGFAPPGNDYRNELEALADAKGWRRLAPAFAPLARVLTLADDLMRDGPLTENTVKELVALIGARNLGMAEAILNEDGAKRAMREAMSALGIKGAAARHTETNEIKARAIAYYSERKGSMTKDAAAQAFTRIEPVRFRTVRDWLKGL